MLDDCGDSVGFPDAAVEAPCVDHGRLAGLLLRLHARRFSGLAYVSAQSRTVTFAFHDGVPVMIETSTIESTLADELVERGLLSRDQYANVIARVTEQLIENEDVAFCEHAVALGYLNQEQVSVELSERVRARLIQSLALVDCEVELDESPDALIGVVEYPQKLGAAVYMGVRTFYEEDVLQGFVPDLRRHYLRLLKAPTEIARLFELDYEEVALLNAIEPQARASSWFDSSDLERSHALQLIALLVIGRMCEIGPNAFVPPEAERSGVRSAARPEPTRTVARGGANAAPEPSARTVSRAGMSAIREEIIEPRSASRARMPAAQPRARPDSASTDARNQTAAGVATGSAAAGIDAAAEALAEARARVARDREARRGGSYAAQKPLHEPEVRARQPAPAKLNAPAQPISSGQASSTVSRNPPGPPSTATITPEYQKAHLKELWKRGFTGSHGAESATSRKEPPHNLRHAQESLRDGQYARAEELLRSLVEQAPSDDVLRTYHLWAKLRSGNNLEPAQLSTLRDLAKKLVSEEPHAGFACYVLAHLYLADKKDDQAEKYFRKAHQIDKSNKDAERHLVILERRKQAPAEAETGSPRKLFGITFGPKGKNE